MAGKRPELEIREWYIARLLHAMLHSLVLAEDKAAHLASNSTQSTLSVVLDGSSNGRITGRGLTDFPCSNSRCRRQYGCSHLVSQEARLPY